MFNFQEANGFTTASVQFVYPETNIWNPTHTSQWVHDHHQEYDELEEYISYALPKVLDEQVGQRGGFQNCQGKDKI